MQLLQLVETSGVVKQQRFLELLEAEEPAWAEAVKTKMLTFDKIIQASDDAIVEIFSDVKDLNLAAVFHGMEEEPKNRILNLLPGPKRKKVLDQMEIIQPNQNEITTSMVQVLAEIRAKIDKDRFLLDRIHPDLKIEDDLEDKLLNTYTPPSTSKSAVETGPVNTGNADADDEIYRLRKKIKDMQNEMDRLKVQNHDLKAKLERILKLAS